MDRDRFSDEYDPDPDYDRPTLADELYGHPIPEEVGCPASRGGRQCCYRAGHDLSIFPHRFEGAQTVSTDPTESARREMIESGQPAADLAESLGPRWDTTNLQRDFEVIGFMAPFVMVRRKSDGQKGTLEFTHNPRVYFNFQATS